MKMNQNYLVRRIRVYGIVQGVGFRPTVDRHAHAAGITGTVSNKGPYVEIMAAGTDEQISRFLHLLAEQPPKRAAILKIDVKEDDPGRQFDGFQIIESAKTKGEIFISPDIATCDECRKELFDPHNRRYLHPFINCTCCGPRLTILDALPYDRERTSMKEFPMCPQCAGEYYDPASRRYDAQPVCCNDCGPEVYIIGRDLRGPEAITFARKTVAEGGIIAVKGIGGFHLCCDATNPAAVQKLRVRKPRPMKPFAVMLRDEQVLSRECTYTPEQLEIITGHQKPIMLLPKKAGGYICPETAPDNPMLGVMLPYAPVQMLLFTYPDGIRMPDALVMTSGNISGAPICRDDESAVREIGRMCDAILSNNRKIRIRADDSVMDFHDNEPYMIRRSRGYAPIPYILSEDFHGNVLAIGGELKNTFALGEGSIIYPSSYVGDLADLRTVEALEESIARMETLLEIKPEIAACDLHPRYNSTAVARKIAEAAQIPLLPVQHHYAHVLSLLAENDRRGPIIGIAFDGTGYGTDGTIWGGELLLADYDGFQRSACIVPFRQIGGDSSSKEGWRIAVSMIRSLQPERSADIIQALQLTDRQTMRAQFMLHDKGLNQILSTSAGRLFDAVSAVLGIRRQSTFEGEASTALMYRALEFAQSRDDAQAQIAPLLQRLQDALAVDPAPEHPEYLRTDLIFRIIIENRLDWLKTHGSECLSAAHSAGEALGRKDWKALAAAGEQAGRDENALMLAYYFHAALALEIRRQALRVRASSGVNLAGMTGGVFQNRLLLRLTQQALDAEGFELLRHHLIPPNDGGIALGQAVSALSYLKKEKQD